MTKKIELSSMSVKLFDAMNDGIIITDSNSVVTYINSSYSNLTGIKSDEIVGKRLKDVREGSRILEVLHEKKPMLFLKRLQGGFESYCDLIPILDDNNEVMGGLIVVKDAKIVREVINEREKAAERKLYFDNKIKDLNKTKYSFDKIVGKDTGMKDIVHLAKKIASTNINVLILGESGTGKEVLAQSIHNYSHRKDKQLAVNCSAIPENLWESEFFGYRGGAFSGSRKDGKLGLLELADGGTLFLDEVGEIPLHLQSKLLRVLETKKIRQVGAEKETMVDFRIIAATNQDLKQKAISGEFRQDL